MCKTARAWWEGSPLEALRHSIRLTTHRPFAWLTLGVTCRFRLDNGESRSVPSPPLDGSIVRTSLTFSVPASRNSGGFCIGCQAKRSLMDPSTFTKPIDAGDLGKLRFARIGT
jgi:hypothetical protein